MSNQKDPPVTAPRHHTPRDHPAADVAGGIAGSEAASEHAHTSAPVIGDPRIPTRHNEKTDATAVAGDAGSAAIVTATTRQHPHGGDDDRQPSAAGAARRVDRRLSGCGA
ncbi:hypothetical protein Ntsu_18400 [Nocardia sp. IFM 10818]